MTTHDSVKHADLSPVFGGVARQVQDKIPLVLLHGWGMNRCIWEPLLPGLGQRFAVTAPDLPGHGQRQAEPLGTLEQAVASLLPLIPAGAVVLGYEPKAGVPVGNLAPTDGYKSIALAATYKVDNVEITGAVSYYDIGDATTTSIGSQFKGNDGIGVGIRVGYTF